jgi:hypothetical protein
MGSESKRKGGIDMGNYTGSVKERDAYMWCVKNGIFISPKAVSTTEWKLAIVMHGKENISPESYKIYVYYYDKYNNILKEKPNKEKPIKRQQTENCADNLKLF